MNDQVLDIFREEAREHLSALESGFLDLESADGDEARRPIIDSIFRHAHSLKGDARAIGLRELQVAAQSLEDVLDELRDDPTKVDSAAINKGLQHLDRVKEQYKAWQGSDDDSGGEEQPETDSPSRASPSVPRVEKPRVSEAQVAERVAGTEKPPVAESGPSVTARAGDGPEESFTVRVPSERLDRMLNLAGEMQIAQRSGSTVSAHLTEVRTRLEEISRTSNRASESDLRQSLDGVIDSVRRVESSLRKQQTREELLMESLEGDIRQARLLPLAMLADSLRRPIRDLAQSLKKQVSYEVDVGKVLLDKVVIEALKEPLLHLIRNAIDHGIESPAQREQAGKQESGVIRLQARQRGEHVKIAISDDGAGLNFSLIRDRLHERGGYSATEVSELSEMQLAECLFEPGFSTAAKGEVSGRGVGLDVVQNSMHRLQGDVVLSTSSDRGTVFEMTVPISISTVRILTVWDSSQWYGIPSTSVVRTGRARPEDLKEMEGIQVLPVDGEPVRWISLSALVGSDAPRAAWVTDWRSYMLVTHEGRHIAIVVDDFEEEREVLLKPLGFPLGGMPGIIGATIRPDGAVQVVLDPTSGMLNNTPARVAQVAAPSQSPRILVVDDSPTTRTILKNVLTAAGYTVRTATDGIDALEKLRSHQVDLVVSDFEMPRLNGVDLTRQIKAKLKLPVILVTGREKEQYRREGLEAGADAYVVKSTFEGDGLLDIIRQLV